MTALDAAQRWPSPPGGLAAPLSDGNRKVPPTKCCTAQPHAQGDRVFTSMHLVATLRQAMNSIIYIVGLVVIVGVILSYFGFR